jgi:hypothetical protein
LQSCGVNLGRVFCQSVFFAHVHRVHDACGTWTWRMCNMHMVLVHIADRASRPCAMCTQSVFIVRLAWVDLGSVVMSSLDFLFSLASCFYQCGASSVFGEGASSMWKQHCINLVLVWFGFESLWDPSGCQFGEIGNQWGLYVNSSARRPPTKLLCTMGTQNIDT